MILIDWFKRKGNKVVLDIESGINVSMSVYSFEWSCTDENYAQLLTTQFNEQLARYKSDIARNALHYLSNEEKSQLKRSLKNWNAKEHHWK